MSAKTPLPLLAERLAEARRDHPVGSVYAHYIAGDYRVTGHVVREDDGAILVIYASNEPLAHWLHKTNPVIPFCRPLDEFAGYLAWAGKKTKRFTRVAPPCATGTIQ